MKTTESKDLNLVDVIDSIYSGDFQLPEFQREYVWKDSNIKSLFESVLSAHPIGTILLLEINKENPLLAWTNFSEIIPPTNRTLEYEEEWKEPPSYLVLDGQQRLTSLSHLTHGTPNNLWYLDLIPIKKKWEEYNRPNGRVELKSWIEQRVELANYIKKGKRVDDPIKYFRGEQKKMPLIILKDKNTFNKALNEVRDNINGTITEKNYEKKNYKKLNLDNSIEEIDSIINEAQAWSDFLGIALPTIVDNYFDFKLPTVVVSKEMGITGVCKVFTKINTTGIELGAFDLTVAVMYPKGIRLKQKFDDAIEKYPLLRALDDSSKRYLLHTIALMADVSPKTASLPETLKASHFKDFWDDAVTRIEEACQLVDEHCGAGIHTGDTKYLVYSPLISVLAYILKDNPITIPNNKELELLRRCKLRAWYFGSGISNRYSEGTDSKQLKDKTEMSEWFASASFDDKMPGWLKPVWGELNSSKTSAMGKAIISLYNILHQKDFYEDKLVSINSSDECDLHHIFPKAAMRDKLKKERGIKDNATADKILKSEFNIDSVLNLTWLLSTTNRNIIKDRLPSDYIQQIIKDYGGGEPGRKKIIGILSNHCISEDAFEALLKDDYHAFIALRKKAIIDQFKTNCHVRNILEVNENTDTDIEE